MYFIKGVLSLVLFRLIVIAEQHVACDTFPIPLLNRFEKHFIATSTVLTEKQRMISRQLADWAKSFAIRKPSQVHVGGHGRHRQ